MARPFVRVLGLAFVGTSAGCAKPAELPDGAAAAAALPTWDEVPSTHPEGATNPPTPILLVTRDTGACYKQWIDPRAPSDPEIALFQGKVLPNSRDLAGMTQVQCPEGQPDQLLAQVAELRRKRPFLPR